MVATQYPNYLTTRQAAMALGVAEVSLKRWRAHGNGPASISGVPASFTSPKRSRPGVIASAGVQHDKLPTRMR